MSFRKLSILLSCTLVSILHFDVSSAAAFAAKSAAASAAELPTTYRALVGEVTGKSFSDVATVKSLPLDAINLGDDEVLIKVVYAGVNGGCETFRSRGDYAFSANKEIIEEEDEEEGKKHYHLGAEGVGIIHAVGSSVKDVKKGQAVGFVGSAFSEYTKAKAMMVWLIPDALPEYVGLVISALTSCAMLEKTGKIREGETILITAAAGAAGHFGVQFAKLAGCTVIGTCGSDEKETALKNLGCDHVINYKKQDVETELKRLAPDGVDVVYEGVGGKMMQIALGAMKPKPSSRLLQVGYISEYPHNPDAETESSKNEVDCADLFWNKKTIVREDGSTIYGNAWPKDMSAIPECKMRILRLFADGKLKSFVDKGSKKFHGLDSVSDAVEYMLTGKAIGKVVVKI